MNETVDFVAKVLMGVGSIIVGIASVYISRKARSIAKSSAVGSMLSHCVERYESIMRIRHEAKSEKDHERARQYYRELFDLFWSETYLWIDGMIPDYIMLHWIQARSNSWQDKDEEDKIETEKKNDDGRIVHEDVTYTECWEYARDGVFKMDECFKAFMVKVHDNKLNTIKELIQEKETLKHKLNKESYGLKPVLSTG